MRKALPREMRIWINKDGTYEWKGKELFASEIIAMGAVLQQHGLNLMDGIGGEL